MADKKDQDSPATTSIAYDTMVPRWALIEALLGGTEAMRAQGQAYLPRHQEETDDAYQSRLLKSVLNNVFEQTVNNLASKPFSEEMKLNDDVPEAILPLMDDVDLQGNKLAVFAREWFRVGLSKAFCHVLVDMPRIEPNADGSPRTLAQDRAEQVRPYWVLIRPENVLFMDVQTIDGVETITHMRIIEFYTQRVGFAEVVKKRIKVLEPGLVQVWEPLKTRNAQDKEQWAKIDEYTTGFDYVPLVTFYAGPKETPCIAKPPLMDLAWMNVEHWQSSSEQRHALTVARFPILACSGSSGEDSDPIVVGPNKVLYNEDPQGKFYYVEHTGAAIEAGRLDIEALEQRMAGYGAEFLKDRPGDPTATAKALDSAEANSDLAAIVVMFEDAVAQALDLTAKAAKAGDEGGTIELVKAFTPDLADAPGLIALQQARAARDLSRKSFLEALVLRGVLPEDFDMEENDEQLQDETDNLMSLGGTIGNIDPNAPDFIKKPQPPEPEPGAKPEPAAKKPAAPAKKPAAAPVKK